MAAYLPRPAMVILFFDYVLKPMPDSFKNYFKKHVCREFTVDGCKHHMPLFYCGAGSKSKAGHGPSQNLAELAIKLLKEVVREKPVSEIELLEKLKDRYRLATTAPTFEHGFLGPSQTLTFTPIPLEDFSPDLTSGNGRHYKSLGDHRVWPTLEKIMSAQKVTQRAHIEVQKYLVMRRFWGPVCKYVVSAKDAADCARLMSARSFAALEEAWRSAEILCIDNGEEIINLERVQHFYWVPSASKIYVFVVCYVLRLLF